MLRKSSPKTIEGSAMDDFEDAKQRIQDEAEKNFLASINEAFDDNIECENQPDEGKDFGKKEMEASGERYQSAPSKNEAVKKFICG